MTDFFCYTERMSVQDSTKKTIVVIEDDPFYSTIFEKKLTLEGYNIIHAPDGEQGLKAIREKKPDLILLDMIMPVKDGMETLKDLRADPALKDSKVIVLSNLGQESDIQMTKEYNALDYIVKSNMSIQEMVEKVRKYLS